MSSFLAAAVGAALILITDPGSANNPPNIPTNLLAQLLENAPIDAARDFNEGQCILYTVGPAKGYLPGTDMTSAIVPSYYRIVDMEAADKDAAPASPAIHDFSVAYAEAYNRIAVHNCGRTL